MDKLILHYINRDKFTSGYINFMKVRMNQYYHVFLTRFDEHGSPKLDLVDNDNVFEINNWRELIFDRDIQRLILNCEKFIISGVHEITPYLNFYDDRILNKVYLHFWGGDFYPYREEQLDTKNIIQMFRYKELYKSVSKCQAVLNLIEEDYNEFVKVIPIDKKHFQAPMVGYKKPVAKKSAPKVVTKNNQSAQKVEVKPVQNISIQNTNTNSNPNSKLIRILVGNSAFIENQHIQAYEMLAHFAKENIEIISPLSYGGTKEYREEVIAKGKEIFGDKYKPLLMMMDNDAYHSYLFTKIDIGVFNNNRQQGMGNISALLRYGKKVYIRNDTPMWQSFNNHGYKIFDVDEIQTLDFANFLKFSPEQKKFNRELKNFVDPATQWTAVFNDKISFGGETVDRL